MNCNLSNSAIQIRQQLYSLTQVVIISEYI